MASQVFSDLATAERNVSKLTHSVLANLIGKGLTVGLTVLSVPWYVRLLGIEAYGLVGFFASLQAVFSLLNLGFSTTVNRELAHLSALPNSQEQQRTLVRTGEFAYWTLAVGVASVVFLLAGWLGDHWLSSTLDPTTLWGALVMMGIVIALQFPFYLYQGVLFGLDRQIPLNIILGVGAILRIGGALAVLYWVAPSIILFFAWNAAAAALQTFVTAVYAWHCLPKSGQPARFNRRTLQRTIVLGADIAGIAVAGATLVQLDRIILSRSVSLAEFAYYALAATIASGMIVISQTVFNAILPRFSFLKSAGIEPGFKQVYHRASQFMALLVVPAGAVLTVMSRDVLKLWTGSDEIADRAWLLVSLLVLGSTLNALYNVPLALQLAFRKDRVSLVGLTAGLLVLTPSMLWVAPRYGGVGVALISLGFYAAYLVACAHVAHRRILPTECWRWLWEDVVAPMLASFSLVLAWHWLRPVQLGAVGTAFWLAATWTGTSLLLAMMMPAPRMQLRNQVRKLWSLASGSRERLLGPAD